MTKQFYHENISQFSLLSGLTSYFSSVSIIQIEKSCTNV